LGDIRGYYNYNKPNRFIYSEDLDTLIFYHYTFGGTPESGVIYTDDWGEKWHKVGFNTATPADGTSSSIDGPEQLRLREVTYNSDEAYWYGSGRIGSSGTERTFVSTDLKKWTITQDDLAPYRIDNTSSLRVIEHIGGNQFWRAGFKLGELSSHGEVGTVGEVGRDIGVLKFGTQTILTDSNMVEFVNEDYIADRLPSQYERTGLSTLLLEPNADASQVGTVRKRTGKFASASLSKIYVDPLLSAAYFEPGIWQVSFNANDVTDSYYTIVGTIESGTDWTKSARTVTFYEKSNTGFKIMVERTDTGVNQEEDAKTISIMIHE
jgi:hypothetical protein